MVEKKKTLTNRQALRDYNIDKVVEAGLELKGTEVKSLRAGKANLQGSFARFRNGELYIVNMHISPYEFAQEDEDPLRDRKLLLHRSEIRALFIKAKQQGFTIVPLKVYFRRGYAKVELALAKGKKLYDKRHALKEKEAKKEIDRIIKRKSM